jgi:hypothetical protein
MVINVNIFYRILQITSIVVCAERRRLCRPKATPPLPTRTGEPTEKSLFLIQKKFGGGNLKKYAKGVSGGARSSFG